jgi:hypothetical protein
MGFSMTSCVATLTNDELVLDTGAIRRTYVWRNGLLDGGRIEAVASGLGWNLRSGLTDFSLPGLPEEGAEGTFAVEDVAATSRFPAHRAAVVTVRLGTIEVRRRFRLYPGCPAIACDWSLRGDASGLHWRSAAVDAADLRNIENAAAAAEGQVVDTTLLRIGLPGRHWRVRSVRFWDVTDRNNTLVEEQSLLPYRHPRRLAGNLLFAGDLANGGGLFLLKEAPYSNVQLAYPGADFVAAIGELRVLGVGVEPGDLDAEEWTPCYGTVFGVSDGSEKGQLAALRDYQLRLRTHREGRDRMIMMNTWGDRGQDSRIRETFCLAELEAGARLGITHFQLDDGWQAGRSANSAFAGGSFENIWDNPDYWTPHPERFPQGLGPVVTKGRGLGIEVCVWFNPSKDDSYGHWREDANAMVRLHREHGIRTFKIDGVQIPDKRAETNLRRMFDTVMGALDGEAVFNLDVTAGRRYGYHYFGEYGNLFLENRYTDWGNYYPHWTLRNLWMLSRYVPARNLQIEFLNLRRNPDKYPADDPLAPAKVSFAYAFAVAMMAQPLAWFEGTGLHEEAFGIAPLLQVWREHAGRFHAGTTLPVGDEPDGFSWTGFQSLTGEREGYLLVLREHTAEANAALATWFEPGCRVRLTGLAGEGTDGAFSVDDQGRLPVSLTNPLSFAFYRYTIED